MPPDRKYSRSKSPNSSSNRHKRDKQLDGRSPPYSQRSRDRSRSRDRRQREYTRSGRSARDYDIDRERERARERGLRQSHGRERDQETEHHSRSVARRRSDTSSHREGNTGRIAEVSLGASVQNADTDHHTSRNASKSTSTVSLGQGEREDGRSAAAAPTRVKRSRFDQSDSSKMDKHESDNISRTTLTPGQESLSSSTEDEKLRQRQERIALWKKRKAEETAATNRELGSEASANVPRQKIDDVADRPRSLSDGLLLTSSISASVRPSKGIGKFEIAKHTNSKALPRKGNFDFGDEDSSQRPLPEIGIERLSPNHASHGTASIEIEDEVDPLDAFMAENSSALKTQGQRTRLAGDILNNVESDEEAALSDDQDILALAAKRSAAKKKDLAGVDHSKQQYEDFRKDFYIEPDELAELTDGQGDAMRLELDGISIRGKDCPKPVSNWGQCGLSAATLDQIQRLGYDSPTSIQAQAIPAIMSGRDTIGVAKTGSGKTVAFLLPMFRHIKDQRPVETMEGPIAMIMTPTRELAVQIHRECKPFLKALNLRAVCAYGGPPIKDQIAEFKRGAEIVVCTPGRMIDILAANQGRVTNLLRITYTVLDEADRMFDLGFEPQVMKILNNIRPQRQTVLFSATFPKSMEALARKILRGKPLEITVGARSVVAPEIKQIVEVRPADPDPLKFNRVLEILGDLYNTDEDARTLIFVDRQEAADSLLAQLMRKGYPCNALHGGKDQYDRDSTISDFKAGIFPILVATSVAARGLDVKQLKLVINYDCPNHMEDYVHRVGRTGRAGNTGTAITFVGEDQERYAFDIAKALRLSQADIPDALKQMSDAFAAKVKAGLEKGSVAGFGGKGLSKFDSTRDKEKKVQRRIYGEDEEVDDEDTIAARTKALEDAADDEGVNSEDDNRINPEEARAVIEGGSSTRPDAPIKVERLTAASKIASKTRAGTVGTKVLDPVAAARARIDAINNRIKVGGKAIDQVSSNVDAGEYRAMMEINDYPQKARWNVTNRTNIAKILEATGTSITTSGQYIKPGSTAPAGVPKLYLLIEGPTEICVTDAVKELRRLLSEGTMADMESGSTRYKVV